MGCDIHMVIQRQSTGLTRLLGEPDWELLEPPAEVGWDEPRSYTLFGVLAGVRDMLDIEAIADRRGLPDDFDPDRDPPPCRWYPEDRKDLGDHSFTWMTLAEVLAFNWDRVVTSKDVSDHYRGKTVRECVPECWFALIEWLQTQDDPECIRLVMGFDS